MQAHWEAPLQAHWEAPLQAHWEAPLQAHWDAPLQTHPRQTAQSNRKDPVSLSRGTRKFEPRARANRSKHKPQGADPPRKPCRTHQPCLRLRKELRMSERLPNAHRHRIQIHREEPCRMHRSMVESAFCGPRSRPCNGFCMSQGLRERRTCPNVAPNLFQTCPKFVPKLHKNCFKLVPNLSQHRTQIAQN